ncbi:Retrovirus-related Pol polyprotein [Senna tora]|uniref:Retrovirus-related Pol polyprotein n=1 Tax=Senna tora TaxID=362788 RepID=A0A834SF55_9FABA|nr:Retrovirus-related Pol polyprotein [Senna tora]
MADGTRLKEMQVSISELQKSKEAADSVEVPHFVGTDVERWLFKMEEFFELYATPMKQRVKLASLHMEEDASDWYMRAKRNGLVKTCSPFYQAIKLRFGGTLYEDPKLAMKELQQTGTVEEYQAAFEKLSTKILKTPLSKSGVNSYTRSSNYSAYSPNSNSAKGGSNGESKGGVTYSMVGGNAQQSSAGSTTNYGGKMPSNYRSLMAEEIRIKRVKGECYYCDAKYTTRKNQFFDGPNRQEKYEIRQSDNFF